MFKHGVNIKNIHRIITCEQSRWLKPFIDLNSKLRADAKNDVEKDLHKVMKKKYLVKQWKMLKNIWSVK